MVVVLGAVGLGEPVRGAGVAVELHLQPVEVELGLEQHQAVLVDVRVGLGVVAEERAASVLHVDVLTAVVHGRGRDVVGHAGGQPQRHRRAHRPAEQAHRAVRGVRPSSAGWRGSTA